MDGYTEQWRYGAGKEEFGDRAMFYGYRELYVQNTSAQLLVAIFATSKMLLGSRIDRTP
jgi:hypothetical protein